MFKMNFRGLARPFSLMCVVLIMGSVLGCGDNETAVQPVIPDPVENDPPQAVAVWVATSSNAPLGIPLQAHDPDDDPLTFHMDKPPEHGTMGSLDTDTWVYTPEEDFEGIDTVTFHAEDGTAASAAVEITITVGKVWYVRQVAGADGDGASWETAFDTPQEGVDAAAADGGFVWVMEGMYLPGDPDPAPKSPSSKWLKG